MQTSSLVLLNVFKYLQKYHRRFQSEVVFCNSWRLSEEQFKQLKLLCSVIPLVWHRAMCIECLCLWVCKGDRSDADVSRVFFHSVIVAKMLLNKLEKGPISSEVCSKEWKQNYFFVLICFVCFMHQVGFKFLNSCSGPEWVRQSIKVHGVIYTPRTWDEKWMLAAVLFMAWYTSLSIKG